jgi:hypothetical protein
MELIVSSFVGTFAILVGHWTLVVAGQLRAMHRRLDS